MRPDRPIPEVHLERYALGELPEPMRRAIAERLAADPAEAARLQAIVASNQALLAEAPPAVVARQIRQRLPERRGMAWPVLVPLAVAATLAVVWFPRPTERLPAPALPTLDDGIRLKGLDPALRVYREGDAGEPLEPGAVVGQGDVLQLTYVPAGRAYGVVVSIDGRGQVTLHHPADESAPARLLAAPEVALEHAYELDDAPDFERFILVASDRPLGVAAVLQAAKTLAADPVRAQNDHLPLGGDSIQVSVTLRKEEP